MTPLEKRAEQLKDAYILENENYVDGDAFIDGVMTLKDQPEVKALLKVLEIYADRKKWEMFISNGGIFEEQDGDWMCAFDHDDEDPYRMAEQALKAWGEFIGENK